MFATRYVGCNGVTLDLTEVISGRASFIGMIRSVQSYLLSSKLRCNDYTDAVSITERLQLPESCAGAAGGYNPWFNVVFSNTDQNSRKNGEVSKRVLCSRSCGRKLQMFLPPMPCVFKTLYLLSARNSRFAMFDHQKPCKL